MPISEQDITGRKYRVWDTANNIWKRFSFWTKASDVELNSGSTVEIALTDLQKDNTYYCTCSSTASTSAKVVTTSRTGFTLEAGVKIIVRFTYANTVATGSSLTLNVNNTGAKPIGALSGAYPNKMDWKAYDVLEFVYANSQWKLVSWQSALDDAHKQLNATYNNATVPFQFGIDSNGKYGYIKSGETSVTPFKTTHTETKTISATGTTDMGEEHAYRYVTTSGLMVTPTATKAITANGNNIDVLNYAKVNVSVNDIVLPVFSCGLRYEYQGAAQYYYDFYHNTISSSTANPYCDHRVYSGTGYLINNEYIAVYQNSGGHSFTVTFKKKTWARINNTVGWHYANESITDNSMYAHGFDAYVYN